MQLRKKPVSGNNESRNKNTNKLHMGFLELLSGSGLSKEQRVEGFHLPTPPDNHSSA